MLNCFLCFPASGVRVAPSAAFVLPAAVMIRTQLPFSARRLRTRRSIPRHPPTHCPSHRTFPSEQVRLRGSRTLSEPSAHAQVHVRPSPRSPRRLASGAPTSAFAEGFPHLASHWPNLAPRRAPFAIGRQLVPGSRPSMPMSPSLPLASRGARPRALLEAPHSPRLIPEPRPASTASQKPRSRTPYLARRPEPRDSLNILPRGSDFALTILVRM